jgi:hypothetical protein
VYTICRDLKNDVSVGVGGTGDDVGLGDEVGLGVDVAVGMRLVGVASIGAGVTVHEVSTMIKSKNEYLFIIDLNVEPPNGLR